MFSSFYNRFLNIVCRVGQIVFVHYIISFHDKVKNSILNNYVRGLLPEVLSERCYVLVGL